MESNGESPSLAKKQKLENQTTIYQRISDVSEVEHLIDSNDLDKLETLIKQGHSINKPNQDGNTALHIAVSKDANLDILRVLLTHGADVNAVNRDGKRPVECLNSRSTETAINLLLLEKDFDLCDDDGNTIMHLLMGTLGDELFCVFDAIIQGKCDQNCELDNTESDKLIESFWSLLVRNFNSVNIDINKKNNKGSTPLHLAAASSASIMHLKAILSQFEDIDHFVRDSKGETFIHIYLAKYKVREYSDFDVLLLQGHFKGCPKSVLKEILVSQNDKFETPLHLYFKNLDNDINIDTLQLLLDAGARFDICDYFGTSLLHLVSRDRRVHLFGPREPDESEKENIKFLVSHAADPNVQNKFGESPIFKISNKESVKMILAMGASPVVRNKSQQTPLLSLMNKDMPTVDVMHLLLEAGSDVNVVDRNGNSVLHYAAWHGHNAEVLNTIKQIVTNYQPDNLGYLPCHVALRRGNIETFNALCRCRDTEHENEISQLTFKQDVIDCRTLMDQQDKICHTLDECFKGFRGDHINQLLNVIDIGPVKFREEASLIMSVVTDLVSNICKRLAETEESFSGYLMQSGSVGERSKVGYPDEFDFVWILDKISELCVVDYETTDKSPGFAYLRKQKHYSDTSFDKYFNEDGFLETSSICEPLSEIIIDITQEKEHYTHPNIWPFYDSFTRAGGVREPTCKLQVCWTGCYYKNLVIDIDLAPAIKIKGWWPPKANLGKLACDKTQLVKDGCIVLVQKVAEPRFRVSASTAEKAHLASLPKVARDAYMVSKILCGNKVCPGLKTRGTVWANDHISSYMLKNCLFHVFNELDPLQGGVVDKGTKPLDLYEVVCQIFKMVMHFSSDENLPAFVFPWQNVFTFTPYKYMAPSNQLVHYRCRHRVIFAKFILVVLGVLQNTDIVETDIEVLLDKTYFSSLRSPVESEESSVTDSDSDENP